MWLRFARLSARRRTSQRVGMFSVFKPAKRGDGVKPGVERSGTPGLCATRLRACEAGDSPLVTSESGQLRCRTFHVFGSAQQIRLGFRFASTRVFSIPGILVTRDMLKLIE